MTTGHFIAHGKFAFHRHINFDHFDYSGRQVITFFITSQLLFKGQPTQFTLVSITFKDLMHLLGYFGIL